MASLPGSPARPSGAPLAVAAFVLVLSLLLLNIPYFALTPGPAEDVIQLIDVRGAKTNPVSGQLLLTTVSLHEIKLFEAIQGLFNPNFQVISRSTIVPRGETDREVVQRTTDQMQESQVFAAAAALKYLGYRVPTVPSGVRVDAVASDAPAATALHAGDVIIRADGTTIRRTSDFRAAVMRHKVGDEIAFTVVRGVSELQVRTKTIRRGNNLSGKPSDPIVGIIPGEVQRVKLPLAIKIDSLGIGGPSAGLMFAIGIVDLLDSSDIARGRIIAGTGEITVDGVVKPVGGVAQKVAGAERKHAQLFLVPADEAHDACLASHGAVPVYAVSTLKEAISVLTDDRVAAAHGCK